MKKWIGLLLIGMLLLGSAQAAEDFDGTVEAGETVSVTAPYGGTVKAINLREGALIAIGDEIASIGTTKVVATEDGTIRGVFASEGDSAEKTVLYLAPVSKYTISANIDKAYSSPDSKYVTIGETVYIKCAVDGSHQAVGIVTAVKGSDYTVQTTAGELYMEETVYLYRSSGYETSTRIGSGTVSRTDAIAVSGTGSILQLNVRDGDEVERGQTLFETVEDIIDALVSTDSVIRSTVSGVIAEVKAQAGQKVGKGDVLLTVYPMESYQIKFSIPEDMLSAVRIGDSVTLYFNWNEDKSKAFAGTVTEISYVSDSAEGSQSSEVTYSGYVAFTADETVRLGMTVTVSTI